VLHNWIGNLTSLLGNCINTGYMATGALAVVFPVVKGTTEAIFNDNALA
jgi:hypothetical protein